MLVISAILLLVILVVKELLDSNNRFSRVANVLYLPALPLLVLFGISVCDKIAQIPALTA